MLYIFSSTWLDLDLGCFRNRNLFLFWNHFSLAYQYKRLRIEVSIKPQFNNRALIGPEPFKRFRIIKSETNGGTAIVITKIVINTKGLKYKAFWRTIFVITMAVPPFVSLLIMRNLLNLISKAKMIPKKKQVAVAKTAQIKVQPSTGKNVESCRCYI
jgi:hypothetical protein